MFALEHGLSGDDLDLLMSTVRSAVRKGLGAGSRQWWLPFVVYAAESGYHYVGDEYWPSFEQSTPGWRSDQRPWVKTSFQRFAAEYGGAVPTGAFASNFTIIAWPITHAVLPTYLQRQLAQLLFDFRGALTSDLLDDPASLGARLARRATAYTDRFRIFCENTTLVGQVAAALLSGDEEQTPYLLPSTLERIVEGLSEERQARHWLKSAQRTASRVRGFQLQNGETTTPTRTKVVSRATDPRLLLRLETTWTAYAALPDLTSLSAELPFVYDQLRSSRGTVNGAARAIPPSALLYGGQEVRLARWPQPDRPFLQLERGDGKTNRVLADECVITHGPWWVFRLYGTGLAVEVKGKIVRPGRRYLLVASAATTPPVVPWLSQVAIDVQGVNAYELSIPEQTSESHEAALRDSGIAVMSHVEIRPVGIVASVWDGDGEVEWLAGEPAMLGLRSDLLPLRCRVSVDGVTYFLEWSPGEVELVFSLEGLAVGTHDLNAVLLGEGGRKLAAGSLDITIRDPQVRAEGASVGEGIRMLAAPARPTLSDLWDDRATISIDGPAGASAELLVTLRGGDDQAVAVLKRSIRMPVDAASWKATAKAVRADRRFRDAYDQAESCVVSVRREGVGFAALTCERGFQPLRWHFMRSHDGQVVASLVDRTDGGSTVVDFFAVEAPLIAVPKLATEPFDVPARGGLAVARAGDVTAAVVLPTNPNAVFQLAPAQPAISPPSRSTDSILHVARAHQQWLNADLPADVVAMYEQQIVGDAIARSIGTAVGGSHWARLERRLATAGEAADYLQTMQEAVGVIGQHKAIASTIALSLYKWLTPESLLTGFEQVMLPFLASYGIIDRPATPRFLLMLAGRPDYISEWEKSEAEFILDRVLQSPILYRVARFAMLGTRALSDANDGQRGC
ncbi:hypothetical protein GCM10010172_43920 [Paractinoplanes ferrugineus]|uniref:Uncharacterized protein n=1 Tax=Paractinoplanes ferrugineus TaxID=113564 RepID=A0A919J421_9ACTN|nr:hypothetical protein [Actinoplanes ferrugineus]GIE13550.1 hypothetical protein Afe05nite_53900 [Actinoplanes ferrugineus]